MWACLSVSGSRSYISKSKYCRLWVGKGGGGGGGGGGVECYLIIGGGGGGGGGGALLPKKMCAADRNNNCPAGVVKISPPSFEKVSTPLLWACECRALGFRVQGAKRRRRRRQIQGQIAPAVLSTVQTLHRRRKVILIGQAH